MNEDDLFDRLGDELAPVDLDEVAAERIRRQAHAALAKRRDLPVWRKAYRAAEPVFAFGVAAVSLVWVLQTVLLLYR